MDKDTIVEEAQNDLATPNPYSIVLKDKLCVVEEKKENKKYEYKIRMNDYQLPITKGDIIGNME